MNLTDWRQKYNIPYNKTLRQKVIQYLDHKDWYAKSYNAIKKRYGPNTDIFIKLLAATSPRTTVKRNLYLADKTLSYILANKDIDFSYGITHKTTLKNVKRILNKKPISGPKIKAFAAALNGDSDKVVIDSWMLKAFNINRSAPTPNDRKHITKVCKKLAKELNLKPVEIQACLWVYAKTELNDSPFKESNDFSDYLKQTKIEMFEPYMKEAINEANKNN